MKIQATGTPRGTPRRSAAPTPPLRSSPVKAAADSANLGMGILLLLSVVVPELSASPWSFSGAYNALLEGHSAYSYHGASGTVGSFGAGHAWMGSFWRLASSVAQAGASTGPRRGAADDEEDEDDVDANEAALQLMCSGHVPPSPQSGHLSSGSSDQDQDTASDTDSAVPATSLCTAPIDELCDAAARSPFIGPQFMLPTVHSFELTTTAAASAGMQHPELPRATGAAAQADWQLPWHTRDDAANVLALVLAYLPLHDASQMAATCKTLARVVRTALPITQDGFLRLPYPMAMQRLLAVHREVSLAAAGGGDRGTVCLAVPEKASSNVSASSTSQQLAKRCRECRTHAAVAGMAPGTAAAGRCGQCLARNPSGHIVRVFMGQLRRDRTAEFPRFLLSMLFPAMHIPHIESHTAVDRRGKGCAWVHVANLTDAHRLMTVNKHLYLDLDERGQEVVLLCRPGDASAVAALKAFADGCAADPLRPLQLPRQPVVLELPKDALACGVMPPTVAGGAPSPFRKRKHAVAATTPVVEPTGAAGDLVATTAAVAPAVPTGKKQAKPKPALQQQQQGGAARAPLMSLAPASFSRVEGAWFTAPPPPPPPPPPFTGMASTGFLYAYQHSPYGADVLGTLRLYETRTTSGLPMYGYPTQ